jgi:hypothetical protein
MPQRVLSGGEILPLDHDRNRHHMQRYSTGDWVRTRHTLAVTGLVSSWFLPQKLNIQKLSSFVLKRSDLGGHLNHSR